MQKIGIKFEKILDYDNYEPLQYWLDYDFEFEDFEEHISQKKVIELQIEEDEDRAEDIAMLQAFLKKFDKGEIPYQLFVLNDEWVKVEDKNIC